MLLFIQKEQRIKLRSITNFNTSHVTVYLFRYSKSWIIIYISIHLMLLFIVLQQRMYSLPLLFQYISCYCLSDNIYCKQNYGRGISIHLMLLFILLDRHALTVDIDFNTSHVTVYRIAGKIYGFVSAFQYISCYCLSEIGAPCLTGSSNFNTSHVTVYRTTRDIFVDSSVDFNTSHVTVYQHLESASRTEKTYFNTSHVTVYRRHWNKPCQKVQISIHLMLLFIKFSCFCVAIFFDFNTSHVTVYPLLHLRCGFLLYHFNTSHVTVYLECHQQPAWKTPFQYISCYCLSISRLLNFLIILAFQYISCYCLSSTPKKILDMIH